MLLRCCNSISFSEKNTIIIKLYQVRHLVGIKGIFRSVTLAPSESRSKTTAESRQLLQKAKTCDRTRKGGVFQLNYGCGNSTRKPQCGDCIRLSLAVGGLVKCQTRIAK
jgi:hypothetical protein